MDRTLEGKLMRELDDAKHLLTDDEYLRWCNEALEVRKFRHKMRGLTDDASIKRRGRILLRKNLEVMRLRRELVKRRSLRFKRPPLLLLGPPSTHGGAKNANSTDLVYRSMATRSGRGSF